MLAAGANLQDCTILGTIDGENPIAMRIDPDPDNQPTLDAAVLEQLRLDMEEDSELVIDSYLDSIETYLREVERSDAMTPEQDLHRYAHTIKSSAASIGAMRLAHLAAEMENAYRDKRSIDVDLQLGRLRDEFGVVTAGLGR